MIFSKRRVKRISVELPVKVYLFDNKGKSLIGEPLAGQTRNFSPLGAALTVGSILISGKHLVYTCQDNQDTVLVLAFERSNITESSEKIITIHANPVWFDKDLNADRKKFEVGVEFLTDPKSPEIRTLCQEACEDEKMRISLWKKFL